MPKINQNAYEGRSATQQRAGVVTLDQIQNITDLTVAGSFSMEGGSVTSSIGSVTLVAGVATVANTNIAATDRIFAMHGSMEDATEAGILSVTITPETSFTITSLAPADATVATGDTSIVHYIIVREV